MPPEVLHEASKAMKKYKNTGYSILELPHRSAAFTDIVDESKELVRDLCNIGSEYEVVWIPGGGRMQFAMLPMNYQWQKGTPAYIDSGHWAAEAIDYARFYGEAVVMATSKHSKYDRLPDLPPGFGKAKYLHMTTNNTIYGTQYHEDMIVDVPLVADMSSDIFSKQRNYGRYALFYAAAQKNMGTPGVAMVAIRKDFAALAGDHLPPMFSYKAHIKENSVLNTANVSGIYISLLMLRWTKEAGIDKIAQKNMRKAAMVYEAIDKSSIYLPHVQVKEHRSHMNVCFTIKDKEVEQAFMQMCEKNNIIGIEGHRSVGGFRVSLYNPVSVDDVQTLVEIMAEFERKG